ncbi:MAG: M28 family peptidase [Planctomycetes bacterium]|nr:M28 family peptidase [Planctomycetota bacterium]
MPSIPLALRASVPTLLLLLPLTAQAPTTQPLPEDRRAGAATVDVDLCKQWLGALASQEFEGRGTGQPGFQKAADFVAAHFRDLGLEARGDGGSYFQRVPWGRTQIDADKTFVEFRDRRDGVVRIPAARLAGSASVAMSASGDVLLLCVDPPASVPEGRSTAPAIPGLDAVDAEGKVVVAYVRTGDDKSALAMARFAVLQGLQGKNAAAVLFAQSDAVPEGLRGGRGASRRSNPAAAAARRQPLDATFGGDDLQALLRAGGQSPAVLAGSVLATPLPLRGTVEVAIDEQAAPAMNVWAVLPGSDAKLRDEYVVVGSHLDHLGKRGETIFAGADDDGSGTTGVMAVARMFAKNPVKPERSVLFVCFCGEESGLIGSAFFADNCPIPLSSIVGELQMDMIGRDEEENAEGNQGEKAEDNRNSLHLVGSQKLSPALHELCLAANARAGFDLEYDEERMFGRSDHANFAQKGVPIAFFFTGLHRDYHRPSDTPDKIHYEKLLRVARYVYDIAFELATAPGRPEIDPDLWRSYRGKRGGDPAAPMRGAR